MADGSIIIDTKIDNEEAQKELNKLAKSIEKIEGVLSEKTAQQSAIEKEMIAATNAAETTRQKVAELKAELKSLDALTDPQNTETVGDPAAVLQALERRSQIQAELKEQNVLLNHQTKEADRVSQKYINISNSVDKVTRELFEAQTRAGQLHRAVDGGSAASEAMDRAVKEAGMAVQTLNQRLKGLFKRALVFSVITAGLYKLRTWLWNVIKTNKEATQSISQLKGALLTLAQPIVNVIIPAFIALVNIITRVISVLASLVSALFGTTAQASAEAAENLYDEQQALEGVGGAAKKASKSLAGFDEINKLSEQSSGGGGGGTTGSIAPDFTAIDAIKGKISELEIYLSGALLALGAILAFTDVSIPLGLGLMAAGAIGLGSALAINWNAMPDNIRKALTTVLTVLGGAAFVIGAILTLSDASLPLGIGLMVAGAASLGTAAALNWDKLKALLRGELGTHLAILSGSLLVLGAIIAFSGGGLSLGIALMAAGAAGLVGVSALNWDSIKQALQGPFGDVMALASAALLVLGLVLAFSAGGLPLGIALIAAGAAGLVTVGALNWGAILEKLKGVWSGIKNWFNSVVKPKFTKAYWQEKFAAIGDSLEETVRRGVNGAIALLNRFINWANDRLNISWPSLNIAGKEIVPAGSVQLLTIPNVPYLAQGAVIPPNREFLAMLGDQKSGTNIETPLTTMVQAFRQALSEGGYGGNQTVVIEIDGREFGRATYKAYNSESQRVGAVLGGV